MGRGFNSNERWPHCLYQLCEAKCLAEADPHVGKQTFLGMLRREANGGPKIDPIIREPWERQNRPESLPDIDARVLQLIPSLEDLPS